MQEGLNTTASVQAPRAALPQEGQQFGPYRIDRTLGEGGMGAVFDAQHLESGRHVALKVLNHQLESREHRQRFLREGRLAASINHPNSVYIYGTEEIQGTPVITMELVRGGTLEDRVKRTGPLPIEEAVEVILQVIAGLEAAETLGVLHRDVKPSNCFLDVDGTLKIGDFGLSISTAPRPETNLTQTGAFLGTPAFSSPEQLRGDELDVRSDIYSVGVTLYFLLTGRTPFEAKQLVQFLATVLEQPAPSPATYRQELPTGLVRVVLRCLTKRSSQRFASYDELRQALIPFRSVAPTPATLGLRVLAFAIDSLVIVAIAALLPLLWVRDPSDWEACFDMISSPGPSANLTMMLIGIGGVLIHLAYFASLDGIRGATLGKGICRLRVVRHDRQPPGLLRAFCRAAVLFAAMWLPFWVYFAYDQATGGFAYADEDLRLLAVSFAATGLLLASMRRRNGFAAIYEIVSGTRVVRERLQQRRPRVSLPDEPLPAMAEQERIGPYHVLGPIPIAARELDSDANEHNMLLAYDKLLLRKVWIRRCPAAAPVVPQPLRDISRIGRLRWLNGERTEKGGWDAYEAPPGKAFLTLIDKPQHWEAVRFWMLDLAQELTASKVDGTLPSTLDLDRVWITEDGRAKLLDFPAPGQPDSGTDHAELRPIADAGPGVFLKRLAISALEGDVVPSTEELRSRPICKPIPVGAWKLLSSLGELDDSNIPVEELEGLIERPASLSKGTRGGVLVACFLMPLLLSAYTVFLFNAEQRLLKAHPEVGYLSGLVGYYQSIGEDDPRRRAVETLIIDRFRSTIANPAVWSDPGIEIFFDDNDRRFLEGLIESPDPTDDQVSAAGALMDSEYLEVQVLASVEQRMFFLVLLQLFLFALVVLPSMLCAILVGNSLLLRAVDVAIVTRSGAPASRFRVACRSFVLWGIVLLGLGGLLVLSQSGVRLVAPSALIAYGIALMFISERGLADRLCGTWLVPR